MACGWRASIARVLSPPIRGTTGVVKIRQATELGPSSQSTVAGSSISAGPYRASRGLVTSPPGSLGPRSTESPARSRNNPLLDQETVVFDNGRYHINGERERRRNRRLPRGS